VGQVRFDVRSGLRAFLRGPIRLTLIILGLGAALLYVGSLNFAQPPLSLHDGLAFLTVSPGQQLLIVAGGLSVFVGMILASNLAQGFASWLGNWSSVGFVGLYALLFYLPIRERLLAGFQSGDSTSASDATTSGLFSYAGVACCLGILLFITVAGIAGAQRQRNVSGFSFLVLLMLVASYGLLVWGHVTG
jgi:hypothetical protein